MLSIYCFSFLVNFAKIENIKIDFAIALAAYYLIRFLRVIYKGCSSHKFECCEGGDI